MRVLFEQDKGGGTGGGGQGDGKTALGGGAAGGGQSGGQGGGGGQGGAGGTALGGGAANALDWMPDKYRTFKDPETKKDFDLEGSSKKLATAYGELARRMTDTGLPPETAEAYAVDGITEDPAKTAVAELLKDPEMKPFLKSAHSRGLTNKQISFVLSEYLARAPALAEAGAELNVEECNAELKKVWTTDQDFRANLGMAFQAANTFALAMGKGADGKPLVTFDDIEKAGLADNPLFIRLMAKIGAELREDAVPNDAGGFGAGTSKSFDEQIADLEKQLDEMPLQDPRRQKLLDQKSLLFKRKHPGGAGLINTAAR